ncbi:MAG: glycosyltransferase family 39 protein [Dehalococcoidia bacterium]
MTIASIRRHLPALGLILLLACSVRIVWISFVRPDPTDGRFDDTVWYRGAAHFLSLGEGYVNPFTGTPTAGWPPGYPAFLGGVFKLFGEGTWQTSGANVALAAATIAVVYAIGALLFERRTAIIAAAALAVWPGQVYFSSLTLSEPLFTFLFALCVLLLLLVPGVGAWRGAVVLAFGLAVAAATLTRGQAVVLLPLAAVAWRMSGASWREALGWGFVTSVVLALALTPWVIRNERLLGSPVIISTNVGANLWFGHHEGATGRMDPFDPPRADRALAQPAYEVESDKKAMRKGLAYIVTHPIDEIRLSGAKVRALYEADSTALDWNSRYSDEFYGPPSVAAWLRGLANGYWFAALVLAGAGLAASRTHLRGAIGVLPLTVLAWTAMHILFFGDSRFHYPIVFTFALLGARGLVVLVEAVRRPEASLDRRYAAA